MSSANRVADRHSIVSQAVLFLVRASQLKPVHLVSVGACLGKYTTKPVEHWRCCRRSLVLTFGDKVYYQTLVRIFKKAKVGGSTHQLNNQVI